MKACVCISGHLRSFQEGKKEFQRFLIDPNPEWDFDFFIHTWDLRDWRTIEKDLETHRVLEDIKLCFSPKEIVIEKTREWNTQPYMKYVKEERWLKKGFGGKRSKGEHIPAMYYSIYKSNELKKNFEIKNNFIYDLSIRHRTDLRLHKTVNLAEIYNMKDACIFLPDCDDSARQSGTNIRDIFAISSSENIDYYSDVYRNIEKILDKCGQFKPEKMLESWLNEKTGLDIENTLGKWNIIE